MKMYNIRRHCEIMHGDKHDIYKVNKKKKSKETKIIGSGNYLPPVAENLPVH